MSQEWIPRPYMPRAIRWMIERQRCAVWSSMGSGKTSMVLTAVSALMTMGETRRVLVLAPKRVARSVWSDEAAKWHHLRKLNVSVVLGNETQRIRALRWPGANVWTMNYENVPWLLSRLQNEPWPFDTVVIDESVKLKSFRTKQGGLRARLLSKVAFKADRWINLSGLPAPNGLQDLWGQQWFIDQGERLGHTYEDFKTRWFTLGYGSPGQQPLIPQPFAQQQITERLADICCGVDLGFPVDKPVVSDVWVTLPPAAAKIYRDMQNKMYADVLIARREQRLMAFNAASAMMKTRQVANGSIYYGEKNEHFETIHDEKIQALESIVDEACGMPVLCFYHFRADLPRLQAAFPGGRVLKTKRDEDDWNAGQIPILFLHPASAGHGLNLQYGGNIAVFFAVDYSYDPRAQAIERIGPLRQMQAGFKRNVFVYNILARDTVDEMIMDSLAGKGDINDLLLAAAIRNV